MTYAAFGVHRRLIEDEGFDPQSDEYYAEIDKRMASEFPQKLGTKDSVKRGKPKGCVSRSFRIPQQKWTENCAINALSSCNCKAS